MRRVLLTGATGFLGGYVARDLLETADVELFCLTRADDDEGARSRVLDRLQVLEDRYGCASADWRDRLHVVAGRLDDLGGAHDRLPPVIDEVIHAAAMVSLQERDRERIMHSNVEGTRALLGWASARHAEVFNYVSTAYVAGRRLGSVPEGPVDRATPAENSYEESKREAEGLVTERCRTSGMHFRIFRPSIILGDSRDYRAESDFGVYHFANSVLALRAEICARMPDYFRFNPVRILGARDHVVNFIAVNHVARLLVRITSMPLTVDRWFHLVSPSDTALTEIIRIIGETSDVDLQVVHDDAELNPIDTLLRNRTRVLNSYLWSSKQFQSTAWEEAGIQPESLHLGPDDYTRFLEENLSCRAAQLVKRRSRMKRALSLLEPKAIPRPDGYDLMYFAGRTEGPTLVVVNAYGQSLYFWNWLLLALTDRYRVMTWQARGTAADHGLPRFRLLDQVDDLAAILEHEGTEAAHVLAWCTGPKVALEFQRRMPERVRSLTLLAGAFKPLAGFEDLFTEYEAGMEPLCRALDAHPERAETVLEALKSIVAGHEARAEQLDAGISKVLELISVELRELVIGPFLSTSSVVSYARQLLDFWSHDVSASLEHLQVPTLFIGAEFDRIASPEISCAAAMQCPGATYAEVAGGTHFCMFENADLVAELLQVFLRDPEDFDFIDDQVRIRRSPVKARS